MLGAVYVETHTDFSKCLSDIRKLDLDFYFLGHLIFTWKLT